MKRFTLLLLIAIVLFPVTNAANKTSVKDSAKVIKQQGVLPTDGDSTYVATFTDTPDAGYDSTATDDEDENNSAAYDLGHSFGNSLGEKLSESIVPVVAIIMVFGFPVFIVFITFYFRYKNRKAKYQLAQQALAAGKDIPAELFSKGYRQSNGYANEEVRIKGLKNVCLGIGLGLFLWFLTEELGLACVGILIFFIGVGQLAIYYTSKPATPHEEPRNDTDSSATPEA